MRIIVNRKSVERGPGLRQTVLRDLAFTVKEGELTFIIGPSGVGKTTLLTILAGLDPNFDGAIDGRPEVLSMMFQDGRLLPWLTVQQNLSLVRRGTQDEIVHALAAIGLADHAGTRPRELSFGMARRVAFVRALLGAPRLILLDEPFASLDRTLAARMMTLIQDCVRRGAAVVVAMHEVDAWARPGDQVVNLARHQLKQVDPYE